MSQAPWKERKQNIQAEQGLFDMSSRLSHALDKFADMFFAEYDSDEEDDEDEGPPGLDMSILTMSTVVDESRDIRGNSYSKTRGASSGRLYSAPIEGKPRARSRASSALSSTNTIASSQYNSNDSFDSQSDYIETEDSFDTANSSLLDASIDLIIARESQHDSTSEQNGAYNEILIQSSPIARMRTGDIAAATRTPDRKTKSSSRERSGEEVIASKHRKWRRQILEAQRRKEAEKKQRLRNELAGCSTPSILFNSEPGQLFQKIVKCGNLQDTVSFSDGRFFRCQQPSRGYCGSKKSQTIWQLEYKEVISSKEGIGNEASAKRKRKSSSRKESNRRTHGSIGGVDTGDSFETAHSSGMESNKSMLSDLDMQDPNFIKVFIAEASQVGYPFIWHKPSPDGMNFHDPIEIVALLELGFSQIEGDFAGPRLAWYNPEGYALGAIDLLDIRSLAKAETLHLNEFPYAVPGKSMILQLHNSFEVLVLEANSTDSAKRFIHGLRWVVARLTFNLVIGNPLVSCEMLDLSDILPSNYETEMNKAMNDVSNQLVDNAVFKNPQRLV